MTRIADTLPAAGLLAGIWVGLVAPAAAQLPDPANGLAVPDSHVVGVYVNDSFEADELLREAEGHIARQEWSAALSEYDQALDQFGTKVMSADNGAYINIREAINRRIARWPPAGLAVYRAEHESAAARAVDQARRALDADALADIVSRDYCTAAAAEAADLLAEIRLEQGQFGAAARIYGKLVADHPDVQHRPLWTAKQALALALQGRTDPAAALLAEGGDAVRSLKLDWRGGRSFVPSIIQEVAANPLVAIDDAPSESWPTFGGNSRRDGVSDCDVIPTAPLWVFEDFAPVTLSDAEGYFQSKTYRTAYNRGKFLAMLPAVDQGRVFFNDPTRVWALRLDTGRLLWTYHGVPEGEADGGWGDRSVPSFHSCTLFDDRIYVDLGQRPVSYYGYQPPRNQSILACLDAATGRELWRARPQDFDEDPREVQFEGSAAVDASGVYVLVRRRKTFGFEDCYLWKFDHAGALRWRTHLASAATGGFGYRRPTLSVPSLIHDRVYVQTNLGALAAVDAASGLVDWIRVYGHAAQHVPEQWRQSGSGELYPWHYNPMLPVGDDALLAMPLDTEDLLLINRDRGTLTARIPRAQVDDLHTVLGIYQGRVYGIGNSVLCWEATTHKLLWSRPLPEAAPYGRGALTHNHAFVPSVAGLWAYPLDGDEPIFTPWEPLEDGGNVVVLADHIVVAGNDRITSYGLRSQVFAHLRMRMAQHPDDVAAALDLAEIAYRTAFTQAEGPDKNADYQGGAAALQAAIDRGGGFATAWNVELKLRLFEDCLRFASFHLRDQPPRIQQAIDLLEIAAQCPPDPPNLLLQKSRIAAAYDLLPDPGREVLAYHQVLADRSLRELPWPSGADDAGQPAGAVCRARIADLIRTHGRSVYASIDDQAAALLAVATEIGDIDRLDHIVTVMPNALAAAQALLAKADIQKTRLHQPLAAARSLYSALTRYPRHIDPPEIIRRIADCYAQADRPEVAWQWLTKGAREYPSARITAAGRMLTFHEYRARLGQGGGLLLPRLPDLTAPPAAERDTAGHEAATLLYPQFTDHPRADWSRIMMHQEQSVRALESSTGRELWSHPCSGEQPRLIASLDHIVILADRFEIVGLQPADGTLCWRRGAVPDAAAHPGTDPEDTPVWRLHDLHGNRLVSTRSDGLTVCGDVSGPAVGWQRPLEDLPQQALSLSAQFVVYRAVRGAEQLFPVLAADDGQLQRIITVAETRPVLAITQTLTGSVLLITAQSLIAVDPVSGRSDWRVQFDQNLPVESVHATLDGVVLSPDGRHLVKRSLDDGREMWDSETLSQHSPGLTVLESEEELYVADDRRVTSIDSVSGRTWGVLEPPDDTYLTQVLLTRNHLLLICRTFPQEGSDSQYLACLVDRPARSDLQVERDRGLLLGKFATPPQVYCYDDAIIAVSEGRLRAWIAEPPVD